MLYRAIRPFLFALEPEHAHALAFQALRACERCLLCRGRAPAAWTHPALQQRVWNLSFPNPVGLAAGFDKDARTPHVWPLLGFGFAELGTITARAQPGNPRPRLFRLARDRALINRLGFNNAGAAAAAARLARLQLRVPATVPLGLNIGKSRDTPLADAAADYVDSLRHVFPFAAYVTVNVSSPNTPGLRDLQAEEHLTALLGALARENAALAQARQRAPVPLLVKVAPDLADAALARIVQVAADGGAAGLIATNTTIRRDGLITAVDQAGGLSGAPLRDRATAVVRILHRLAGARLPIIGVGGIFDARDAYAKIRAGATLVQLYTGMIFEGPRLAYRVARGLVDLLERDGFSHISAAVGRDA
jgi:dihydroorotate dehydrogenase